MNKIDELIFKVYGNYPCLSPGRYESFYFLVKLFTKQIWEKKKILDIGCGSGIYALILDNLIKGASYTGIDLKFKHDVVSLQKKIKRIKTEFHSMDARKLVFKNNSFDLILSFANLEHIKEDDLVLQESYRVLKKQGRIFVAVPSIFTFPFQFGRHGFHYYTKKEIVNKLKRTGFKIKKVFFISGLAGYFFSLFQNWLDFLVLAPVGLFYLVFDPGKLKGDSRQDVGRAGLSKKILSRTTYLYRKSLMGKKMHFYLLKLIRKIDDCLPVFPTGYFIVAEK